VAMADPFRARPGALRRGAAGAWHVLGGFWFLLRNPSLWPLAALPSILAMACLVGGAMSAYYAIPYLEKALVPHAKVSEGVGFVLALLLAAGTLCAGLVMGLAVAILLSAPLLELLSSKVDARVRGTAPDRSRGFKWEMAQAFRGTLYFLGAAPGVFLLSLIPVLGPPLALFWGSYALAFQQTDAALSRRGMDFSARRAWHRYWKLESLGFGFAGLLFLIVPLANFLIVPALTVGGTLLVLELEDQLIPPDKPSGAASIEAGGAASPPPVGAAE
jgi:CysZ protein